MIAVRNADFWSESLKGTSHSEDLGVNGRIILKCILAKKSVRLNTGYIWLKIRTGGGIL
jgi:hypothetical protein